MEPAVRPIDARRRARRRGGFTLIELLIVIGIVLVLISAGVVGYRALESSASKRQTQAALAGADGLLKGMNSIGAGNRVEGVAFSPTPFYQPGEQVRAPGTVRVGQAERRTIMKKIVPAASIGLETKPPSGSFARTDKTLQRLMEILLSAPENKKAVTAMPREYLAEPEGSPPAPWDPPVLCDAWNNPLILVPSGGMVGVELTEVKDGSGNPIPQTVTSPGGSRPFWASAGPDGSFIKGDDNLYSFDK